ncbi:MAG: hypothetical protein HRT88_04895 [Lentisphaeraceae bacterium]|nr:hypothetical protein [Lentisphaeraceae bacterium]
MPSEITLLTPNQPDKMLKTTNDTGQIFQRKNSAVEAEILNLICCSIAGTSCRTEN